MASQFQRLVSSVGFITFVVGYAVFNDSFLYAAVVPVMPDLLTQKGFTQDRVQVLITTMLAVFGGSCVLASVPCGWYSDRHIDRRKPFLFGLVVILAATGLLWGAPFFNDQATVVGMSALARVFQGLASTIVWTTGIALLVDTVGPARVGEFAGYVGLALNMGNFVGPALGGPVNDHGGYHAVLGLCVGVTLLDFLFRFVMKERPLRANCAITIDSAQDYSESDSEKKIYVELNSIPSRSPSSTETVVATPTTPAPNSKVPAVFRLLRSLRFLVNLFGIFLSATIFTAFEAVLPLTVESKFGWTSTQAGLIFLPFSFPSLFGMLVGKLTDRHGGRWFIFGALVVQCPALATLRYVQEDTDTAKALLCTLLFIIGTCQTITLEPLFAEVARRATEMQEQDMRMGRDVGNGYYAQAYAHFNMVWSLGNTVGPIMAGYLNLARGFEAVSLGLGILCLVSAVPLVLYSEGWVFAPCMERRKAKKAAKGGMVEEA